MIRGFLRILGPQRGRMYGYLAWVTLYGLLHGVAMILLVPISVVLFDERYAEAGRWLGVLAVVVVVAALAHYVQATLAIRMALTTMRLLHHRLGDHMVTLPLGWFNRETVGHVSQIAVKGTVFVGTSGANLITPVVLNSTTVQVNTRVIEFARCQPVLRGFGRAGSGYEPLSDALDTQHRVGRSALWQSVAGLMLNGVAVQAVFSVLIAVGAWIARQPHATVGTWHSIPVSSAARSPSTGRRRFTTATSDVARSPRLLGCRGGKLIASWVDWRGWCAAGLDCFAGG
jgi:ATP-binding cassette, subfamily B, bacterial IrtB/YbtQ